MASVSDARRAGAHRSTMRRIVGFGVNTHQILSFSAATATKRGIAGQGRYAGLSFQCFCSLELSSSAR